MTDTKIGCVQHDCAKCKAQAEAIGALEAKVERLKSELSTTDVLLEECKMDWSGDVTQIKAEHKHEIAALQAQLAAAQQQEPVGTVVDPTYVAMDKQLPYGTKLYAAPIPQQPAQPTFPFVPWSKEKEMLESWVQQAQPEPVTLGLVKTLKLAIDALATSNDCIHAMTDGPGHAAWGPQLDKNELSIAELNSALTAAKQAQPEPTGINGLTESETDNSMSVRGLSKPTAQPYDPIGAWNKGFEEGKRIATEQAQPERAPLSDAELLDFVEEHPHLTLKNHKKRWSFVGLTNYEYPTFKTARDAIKATLEASEY